MGAQVIKTPGGEDMVILPKSEYDRLVEAREALADKVDAREAARILKRIESGEEETFPDDLVKRLRKENRVRVMREYRGLTQAELAKAAGTSPMYLSQIECGRADGSTSLLARLAKALRISADIIRPASKH
jgi:DNA-binding XRE family transcriptional regulator